MASFSEEDLESYINLADIKEEDYAVSSQLQIPTDTTWNDVDTTVPLKSDVEWNDELTTLFGDVTETCLKESLIPYELFEAAQVVEDGETYSAHHSPAVSEAPTDVQGDYVEEQEVVSKQHLPLMTKYQLTDNILAESSLKALKKLCRSDEDEYEQLKAYRRTCLNRLYARQSRNKQLKKTSGLSAELEAANEELRKLKKEIQEKDSRIKCLELANKLLMEFTVGKHYKD